MTRTDVFCIPLSCECTILNSHVLPRIVPRALLKNMIGTVDQDICHILWKQKVYYNFHHLPSSSYNCSAHFQAMASPVSFLQSLLCFPAACQLLVLCNSAPSFPTLSTQLFFFFFFSAGLLPQIFLSRICFGILL